jgi:hypothetical protein
MPFKYILPPQWVIEIPYINKREWVMYLKLRPAEKYFDWEHLTDIALDQKATKVLNQHLGAYLYEGVEPPADIRATIVNLADDILSGRTPVLRTGDYIALRTHMRAPGG